MKKISHGATVLLLLLTVSPLFAQHWTWAKQAHGFLANQAFATASDPGGNVYVTGYYYGTFYFDSTTLSSRGDRDIFLLKLDKQGEVIWARTAGSMGDDEAKGLYVDEHGNAYLTGYFNGTAHFGTQRVRSRGYEDIFIAKYDSAGNALWARGAGGSYYDHGYGITADRLGQVYVTGHYQHNANFGNFNLTNRGAIDIFVAKLSAQGNFLWVDQAGSGAADEGHALVWDESRSRLYVTGYAGGGSSFGNPPMYLSGGGGSSDFFVAAYSGTGSLQWVKGGGSTDRDEGWAIGLDAQGNIYAAGYHKYSARFATDTLRSRGGTDMLLVSYRPNGQERWTFSAGSIGDDELRGLVMGKNGPVLAGHFEHTLYWSAQDSQARTGNSNLFMAAFDTLGKVEWVKSPSGQATIEGNGLARGLGETYYVTGLSYGTSIFGQDTLRKAFQMYVAALQNCDAVFTGLAVDGGDFCEGEQVTVVIGGSEPETWYQAWHAGLPVSPAIRGGQGSTYLPIADSLLPWGEQALAVRAWREGCPDTTLLADSARVGRWQMPQAHFGYGYSLSGLGLMFSDSSLAGNDPIVDWLWDFGDGESDTTQNPIYAHWSPGMYQVCLNVTTAHGCQDSACVVIDNFPRSTPSLDQSAFLVYPNPILDNTLFIEPSQRIYPISVVLLDFQGKTIWRGKLPREGGAISFGNIPAGAYLMRLEVNRRVGYWKVFVL
jgi:hypothetical protein